MKVVFYYGYIIYFTLICTTIRLLVSVFLTCCIIVVLIA